MDVNLRLKRERYENRNGNDIYIYFMSLSRNNYTWVTSISEINGTIGAFCGYYPNQKSIIEILKYFVSIIIKTRLFARLHFSLLEYKRALPKRCQMRSIFFSQSLGKNTLRIRVIPKDVPFRRLLFARDIYATESAFSSHSCRVVVGCAMITTTKAPATQITATLMSDALSRKPP